MKKIKSTSLTSRLIAKRQEDIITNSNSEHFLDLVLEKNSIKWYNNSKSTDIKSTCFALETLESSIIWIVESYDKKRELDFIKSLVDNKVSKIICYGKYDTDIKYTYNSVVERYAYKKTLADAVLKAKEWSNKNDVVLFSPSCPGNNEFEDYKHRGNAFISLINQIV